jgi:hypothetical protein
VVGMQVVTGAEPARGARCCTAIQEALGRSSYRIPILRPSGGDRVNAGLSARAEEGAGPRAASELKPTVCLVWHAE